MVESVVAETITQQGLTPSLCRALVATARLRYPNEACGYILDGIMHEVPNHSDSPHTCFLMHSTQLDRAFFQGFVHDGWFWHSHPMSRAIPSREDVDFMNWMQLPMVIVSLKARPSVVLYGIAGRRIVQLEKWREE